MISVALVGGPPVWGDGLSDTLFVGRIVEMDHLPAGGGGRSTQTAETTKTRKIVSGLKGCVAMPGFLLGGKKLSKSSNVLSPHTPYIGTDQEGSQKWGIRGQGDL